MILFLSELQKAHLNIVHKHSTQILVDFCKLAIDYLNNGTNTKKYLVAAEKLEISATVVQNLVQALVYLIVEGCKHNLTEGDFKSSLALAGFSLEHQEVLVKLFVTKKPELSEALCFMQQTDSTYQDFRWRFEVQVASRKITEEIKPMVAMNFVLMEPKPLGQDQKITHYKNNVQENNKMPSVQIISSIQDAKAASHCQNTIKHVFLQCDLRNLAHLTNKLEEALKESKSQHVRKVQRAL